MLGQYEVEYGEDGSITFKINNYTDAGDNWSSYTGYGQDWLDAMILASAGGAVGFEEFDSITGPRGAASIMGDGGFSGADSFNSGFASTFVDSRIVAAGVFGDFIMPGDIGERAPAYANYGGGQTATVRIADNDAYIGGNHASQRAVISNPNDTLLGRANRLMAMVGGQGLDNGLALAQAALTAVPRRIDAAVAQAGGGPAEALAFKMALGAAASQLNLVTPMATAAQTGDHIALGLANSGLEATATRIGARTLLNDVNWKTTLQRSIGNPSTRFTVSLDGLSGTSPYSQVMGAVQRGVTPVPGGYTNWELAQLYQAGRMPNVSFIQNGRYVTNPFGP